MIERKFARSQKVEEPAEVIPKGSRIAIVCDSYDGLRVGGTTTGVKRTLLNVMDQFEKRGIETRVIYPGLFPDAKSYDAPCAPELELKFVRPSRVRGMLEGIEPVAIFNKTPEGPLGRSALRACRSGRYSRLPFTGNYTTNHDDMLRAYVKEVSGGRLPEDSLDPALRTVYNRALRKIYRDTHKVMVPTERMSRKLEDAGVDNTVVWPRGVDSTVFRPLREGEPNAYDQYGWGEKLPILLYFGRVSKEKKVKDFMELETPGYRKVVIGDGPDRKRLEEQFAGEYIHFLGRRHGEDLAHHVRSAGAMIFPGDFDTFGNVLLEAAASGLVPVAFDVQGPGDVLENGVNGIILPVGRSLKEGIEPALGLDRKRCAEVTARRYTWEKTADILLNNLHPINWESTRQSLSH